MSQNADIIERLRSAKPEPIRTLDHADLWREIVASPGDPRLSRSPRSRSRLSRFALRHPSRRNGLLLCALVVAGCGTGVTVLSNSLSHDTPTQLFAPVPRRLNPLWGPHRHLRVIQSSVRLVQPVQVPQLGAVQFWAARTRQGGFCEALRFPGGGWAGSGSSTKYIFGGISPTCSQNVFQPTGSHFAIQTVTVGLADPQHPDALPGPRQWTIAFGRIKGLPQAARIREVATGLSTPVHRGGYFAILIPERLTPEKYHGTHQNFWVPRATHLWALNASGKVIASSRALST
jgi:hypothetical protein